MTNTQMTERLLATYNKYSPYKSVTPSPSDASKKRFGTWAYANKYDAMYDMYSQNKNFNVDMWRDAFSYGEQDNYLALLEQNKDNALSNAFYDPQYYDYEAMMMELYLPVADDSKLETYTKDVFNAASGKWETEKFQMTQRQYLQYTLDNAREAKRIEIQRGLEQERKDNMSFWQKFGHDTAATLGELGEGLLTGIVGTIDFVGGLGYALAMAPGEDTFADAFVRYFGEIGLTQMEKNTIRRALDEYERKNTHFRDIDGNLTNVGKYFVGISNSIGMMLPSILLAIPTGGTSLAFLPQLTFYTSMFSNSMYETATNPATKDSPSWTKILNVTAKTVAEVVIEKALGAVLGSTIQNSMLNIGRQNLSKIGNLTNGAGVKYLLKSAGQEGLEEFLQDFGTSCIDAFTGLWQEGYGREGINLQTLIDSFVCGVMSSLVLSTGRVGLGAAASSIRNAKVAGSGDTVIEVDGKLQKVGGFTKLYYSQILSDFNSALKELKTGKFGSKKNFALAQEIYSGFIAISQFYSSFDQQRIKNCEMLLNRVVTKENREKAIIDKFVEKNSRAAQILTPDTLSAIMKSDGYDFIKETTLEFASSVESVFNDMFTRAQNTHQINSIGKQIKKSLEKEETKKKLKDGDVHEAKAASSIDTTVERNSDGTIKLKESEVGKKLEEALGKKKATRLMQLHQYYDNICTTDGHVAIDDGDLLFVSESWLENYTSEEIYEFLVQDYTFDTIRNDKKLVPIMAELKKFYKEFVGSQKNLTDVYMMSSDYAEEVLMNFFFNKSFYQAFILSNDGKNVHTHQKNIFVLYNFLFEQGKEWLKMSAGTKKYIHTQQVFNRIVGEIKKTWRDPTMKAIINWGFTPEELKADYVLSPRDLEFINLIADHKRILRTMGNAGTPVERSAHVNLVNTILERQGYRLTDEESELIRRAQLPNASEADITMARAMLDVLDTEMRNERNLYHIQTVQDVIFELKQALNDPESFREESINRALHVIFNDTAYRLMLETHAPDTYNELYRAARPELSMNVSQDVINLVEKLVQELEDVEKSLSLRVSQESYQSMAFIIPHEAAELAMGGDIAGAQHVADCLNEFSNIYGVHPENLLKGNVGGMTDAHVTKLQEDMQSMGISDLFFFVQNRLEDMLGNDYVVVPSSRASWRSSADPADLQKYVALPEKFSRAITDIEMGRQKLEFGSIEHIHDFLRKDLGIIWMSDVFATNPDFETEWRKFWDDFDGFAGKVLNGDKSIEYAFKWLKKQSALITKACSLKRNAIRAQIRNKSDIDPLRQSDRTNINICRKMPSSTILIPELLDSSLTDEQMNDILKSFWTRHFESEEVKEATQNLLDDLEYNNLADWEIDTIRDKLNDIEYGGRDNFYEYLMTGVDPLTGEVFFSGKNAHDGNSWAVIDKTTNRINPKSLLYEDLFNALTTIKLSDLINVSNFQDQGLSANVDAYTLSLWNLEGASCGGWCNNFSQQIVIGTNRNDTLNVLVHETNHLLESYFLHQYGMHEDHAVGNPKVLAHVLNEYRPLVEFMKRVRDKKFSDKIPNVVTEDWVKLESSKELRNNLVYCIYYMAQGEIWARGATHNRNAKGFTTYYSSRNEYRIVAPDGVEFVYNLYISPNYNHNNKIAAPEPTPQMEDVLTEQLVDLWRAHSLVTTDITGPKKKLVTRDTYHTTLTQSTKDVIDSLLSPTLGLFEKSSATLDDIVRDPEAHLRPDILSMMNGDFSEGNVFYRLKEYIERQSDAKRNSDIDKGLKPESGISIDISENGRYIFVNDNAFDDLLTDELYARIDSTDATLYKKYGGKSEGVSLDKFYNRKQLRELGLDDVDVVIRPDVRSEATFDREYPAGRIFINADENTSDAVFIDKLNHEFRHILQGRQGFAKGFTPEIKVTQDMVNDLKKHAPDYFKSPLVRKIAERHKKADETLDETITRYTIYLLSAGEQNAYAYDAEYFGLKPMLHRYEGKDVTIYMPWYDAKSGEGRYTTKQLAMMAEDNTDVKGELSVTEEEVTPKKLKELTEEEIARRRAERKYAREHMPRKIVKSKYESRETDVTPEGIIERVYKYKNDRHFTKKKAEGTNLMNFYRVGEQNQMDLDLQNFIIDTTDHLAELPYSLRESIKKGTLTKQALFRFICDITVTDPYDPNYINDYTFNLLKKHFFPNTPFKNMQEVDNFLTPGKMQMYWAAVPYFYNTFRNVEKILEQNTVEAFEEFINLAENSDKKAKFLARAHNFGRIKILDSNGNVVNLEKYKDWVLDKEKYDAAVAEEAEKAKKKGREPRRIFETDYQIEVKKKRIGDIAGFVPNWQLENRVLALQNFDGSLGGAFYVAWNARKKLAWQYMDIRNISLNQSKKTARGEGTAMIDTLADEDDKTGEIDAEGNTDAAWNKERDEELEANFALEDNDDQVGGIDTHKHKHTTKGPDKVSYGNDIISIYVPPVVDDVDLDDMKDEVRLYLFTKLMSELAPNFSELSEDEQAKIAYSFDGKKQMLKMVQTLEDIEQVEAIYAEMKANEAMGINTDIGTDEKQNDRLKARVNVQTRAKNHGKKIAAAIRDGWISYEELPNDVKIMFRKVEATTSTGKKIDTYELDPAFYEVGRGRKALPGKKDIHHTRAQYSYKYDVTESRDVFKHDTAQIFQNEQMLKSTWNAVKKEVRLRKKAAGKGEKVQRDNVKNLTATEKKKQQELESFIMSIARQNAEIKKNAKLSIAEAEKRAREAERPIVNIQYTVKATGDGKARHEELTLLNDSDVVMPEPIQQILSTCFSYGADTKVQWASIDKDGNLYKKEDGAEKDFESIKQHEIVDFEKFMEINRDLLTHLTRDQVIDSLNSLYKMMPESPSQLGKYNAFKLFLFGFFYAAARDNTYSWNFSDSQVDYIREMYELHASANGIGLNAVKQMTDVIKPFVIGSRFLDDWESVGEDEKEEFKELVEKMQKEKDFNEQRKLQEQIVNTLEEFASRELAKDKYMGRRWSKKWWGNAWKKVKTYRYLAMLSGPGTWVRNAMSNVFVKSLNNASDAIGALIFRKTDYRDEQWDLRGVQVSNEVKEFTKLYIEENPSLKHAYELSGKYDKRGKLKKDADIAVAVITNAYLKYYRAENSPFVVKFIQKRMSDEKFVKTAARKYFNKMLTIEVEKGHIDLADGLSGKVYALFADAVIQANEEYMHKRSVLADLIDTRFRKRYPAATEAINFFFPFLNSGFNWFIEEAINLSPIGLIKGIGRSRKLEARIAELDAKREAGEWAPSGRMAQYLVRRDIGKGVIGTLLWTLGAILCLAGRLRIEEEKDKFYLNFGGDMRVDISNIFGSSSILIGASMVQPFVDGDDTTGLEAALGYTLDTFLDGFFMADMMDRHQYDTNTWDFVGGEFNSALTSFFPQFLQVFVDALDEQKVRYSAGFKGNWEYFVNSWHPTQPAGNKVINVYTGELEDKNALPIPIVGGFLRRGVLGPKIYWVEVSEAERMCREYDANHSELSGEITIEGQKKKLDRISLNKKYGELNKASLATITSQKHNVQMPDGKYKTLHWDQLSDDQRKRVIDRTFSDNAELAKIYTWTQVEGHKYYASASEWQNLKTLGITKNVYKGDKGFVE